MNKPPLVFDGRVWVLALALGLIACSSPPPAPNFPTATPGAVPSPAPSAGVSPVPSAAASPASVSPSPSPAPQANLPPELDHVRLTYPSTTGTLAYAPIAVAQGFFTKYGVTVEAQFAQAGAATAALVSGDTQFSIADVVLTTTPFAAGEPLRIVANPDRADPYAIISVPSIATPQDLRGKTLAIGQIGDASDISARIALKPYGLTVGTDVPVLPGGNSPGRFAALTSGQVGAALLDEDTFAGPAEQQGYHVLISIRQQAPPWMGGAFSVTDTFARNNPRTVEAVLKGLLEGIQFYADDRNRAASLVVIAKDMQLQPDDPLVAAAYDGTHKRSMDDPDPQQSAVDAVLDALRQVNPDQYANVDGSNLIDHSFINDLRSSGYLASLGYTS